MLYGRSDITSVSVTLDNGAEHVHTRSKKNAEGPFVLDCKDCEAKLIKMDPSIAIRDPRGTITTTHWSTSEKFAPKTENEMQAEEDAQRAFAMASGAEYEEFKRFRNQRPVGTASRR